MAALAAAWRLGRRNGAPVSADWRVAVDELSQAITAPESSPGRSGLDGPAGHGPFSYVSTTEAASTLGITVRAVQMRCEKGTLPATRVGRVWLVKDGEQGMVTKQEAAAPVRYRVRAALVSVKTEALVGVASGRNGYTFVSLYRGSVIPGDVPVEDVRRLLADGLIEEVA